MKKITAGITPVSKNDESFIVDTERDFSWHPIQDVRSLVSYPHFWAGLLVGIILMNVITQVTQ